MQIKVLLFVALFVTLTLSNVISAQAFLPITPTDKPTISQADEEGSEEPCPDPDGDGVCNPLPPLTED